MNSECVIKTIVYILVTALLCFAFYRIIIRLTALKISKGLAFAVGAGLSLLTETAVVLILAIVGNYNFILWGAISVFVSAAIILVEAVVRKNNVSDNSPDKESPLSKADFAKENKESVHNKYNRRVVSDIIFVFLLTVIVSAAVFLYMAFPTYYLRGGRDYGLYIVNGVHIAKEGSIRYGNDSTLRELREAFGDEIIIKYPGFYLDTEYDENGDYGSFNPQFLSMFPSACALAYDIWGLEGLVRVNAAVSLISLLISAFFLAEIYDRKAGILFALFWVICPAIIWNSRITESEVMTYFILILTGVIFYKAVEINSRALYYISAVLLTAGSFNRIDNYLFIMVFDVVLVIIALLDKKHWNTAFTTFLVSVLGEGLSLAYTFFYHKGYFLDHFEKSVLMYLLLGTLAVNAVTLAVFIFSRFLKECLFGRFVQNLAGKPSLKWIVTLGLAVFLKYYYGVLSAKEGYEQLTTQPVKEFGYYICPLMYIFFLAGIFILVGNLSRNEGHGKKIMLFYGFGMASLILYTVNPSISSDHFWMSRRWVSINFPFIMMLSSYAVSRIFNLKTKKIIDKVLLTGVTLIGLGIILFAMAGKDTLIYNKSYLKEYPSQYEAIAEDLPDNEIILTPNSDVASILRFIYGKEVYLIEWGTGIEEISELASKYGKNIYYLGGSVMSFYGEDCWNENLCLKGRFPEITFSEYPKEDEEIFYSFNLKKLNSKADILINNNRSLDIMPGLVMKNGVIENDVIFGEKEGVLFCGPFLQLPKGKYEYRLDIETEGSGELLLYSDNGRKVFAEESYSDPSGIIKGVINVNDEIDDFELSVIKSDEKSLLCREVSLIKIE